jgi:hypothetical protein
MNARFGPFPVVLLLATSAAGVENAEPQAPSLERFRPGISLGAGGSYSLSALLVSTRVDLEVELSHEFAPFIGLRPLVAVGRGFCLFANVDLGLRIHVSRNLTIGLAVTWAPTLAFGIHGPEIVTFLGGLIEPFTWTFAGHHELGLSLAALVPRDSEEPKLWILPTIGYTFRF